MIGIYDNSEALGLNFAIARAIAVLGKAGYKPSQPRVPIGAPNGGQWTNGGSSGSLNNPKPSSNLSTYKPQNDTVFLAGLNSFGRLAKSELKKHSSLIEAIAKRNEIDPHLVHGVLTNEASTRIGAGYAEATISGIRELLFGGYGTYGPAQLGPDAREAVGLNRIESLDYYKAIIGATEFLSIQRQKLIKEGIKNPTNAQIASRYNWSGWPISQEPTKYGKRVEYLIKRFYSDK